MTASTTPTERGVNDPEARHGYGVRVTFKRDGIRTVGWLKYDPVKARCSCGAESRALRSSVAAKAWLQDHDHNPNP
jgi:hypothetical protein